MNIPQNLIVPLAGLDLEAMLEYWRWLIPESHQLLFVSVLGDLFVADSDGRIFWLDIGLGQFEQIAADEHEFERAVSDADNMNVWFAAGLVDALREAGLSPTAGECYSYIQLPMLGGEYEPSNFKIRDVVNHFRGWGPILEQIWNLPDGAKIKLKIKE